ncbi:MAG: hypothetical protein ACLP50_04595 [Solirubrobacteraceae bacterium]
MDVDLVVVCAGEAVQPVETVIARAGAHVVAVTTVLPHMAVSLCSSYLSALSGRSAVSHLRERPGESRFAQRVVEALPGITIARGCLLDHAAELRNVVEWAAGEGVQVDVPEASLEDAMRVWDTAPSEQ